MSLFHGRDVSLNTYQYVFYSYSDKTPNVLQATYYDNSQNLMYSTDISFGSKTVGDMMLFLENSQTNPYALGKDNITPYFRNIDIPFSGLYKKVLTTSHHQLLMSHVNSNHKETYGNAMNIYEVKANGSSNYIIDDISQPDVLGSFAGIYVFDQSDSSNSGHILKFRNKSTQAAYEENVTYAGTPGTLNSFTIIGMDYSTPILEYYCEYHSVAMYGEFKISPSYCVKVVTNIVGDSVYALSSPYSSVYYNQPDLSFGAGDYYIFDVSDPTMANYNLVFGTIADDASTINNDVVSETNGVILLDIPSGYSGSPLVLFDLSNANMGYISKPESDSLNNTDLVFHIDASVYNYSHDSQINMSDVSINDISPLGHTLSNVSYTTGITFNIDSTSSRKSLYWENTNDYSGDGGGSDHLQYDVPGGTFPDSFTTFMVNDLQNTIPIVYSRTNGNDPFHCNSNGTVNGDGNKIGLYNNGWKKFNADPNVSDSLNLQTVVYNPNIMSYKMLGIGGETYNSSYTPVSGTTLSYDDDSYSKFYLGSVRPNYSPCKGHVYEFLVYKDAYMSDSTIASIQNYLSKKWFTQSAMVNGTAYNVTVSNEVFYIDDVEKPEITFTASSLHIFDQSDATNIGQQIVFGYTFDSSNVFVSTDGVQVVGTPGQPGAYTSFTVPSNPSGTIHYYSDGSANMGYVLVIEASYVFSVKNNVFDEPVWASYDTSNAVWYNQPDLSFSAPYVYEFDVSDPSNNGYVLSFGTTVDVSDATIETTYVTRTNTPGTTDAKVLLDLRDYSGDNLVYFEDSSAGMGYVSETTLVVDTDVSFNTANAQASSYGTYGTTSYTADLAFTSDFSQQDSWISHWNSSNKYNADDTYSGPSNTLVDNVSVYGEWLQMDFGSEKYIGKFTLSTFYDWDDINTGFMSEFVIAGSLDGTNFTEIGTYYQTNIAKSATSYTSTEITSTNIISCRYIRLIGVKVRTNAAIREWQMKEHSLVEYSPPTYVTEVSGNKFWIKIPDSSELSESPQIDFSANESYLFDQSDSTNAGQQIVFGYTPDNTAILTAADGVTIMGTPGRPGAYTQLDLSAGFVGPLYYYSDGSANMGYEPTIPVDVSYSFTVQTNVFGDNVWSVYDTSNAVWYNQPDLSFSAPYVYEFVVSDPSNNGYVLSFGTTVDVYDAAIDISYVTRTNTPGTTNAKVLLDLTNYSGVSLVYFEDSSAGMGYVTPIIVTPIIVTYNSVFYLDGVQAPYFYFEADTTYILDQSHASNSGNQIVFGPDYDNINTIDSGVTIIGTPGQSGAYTKLVLSSSYVGPIYYYSYNNTGKGSGPQFHLVFVQSKDYWMSDALATHTGYTDVNNQYSIFHKMNNTTYLKYGNTYRWKYYISASKYIIWEQSNNFLNDNTVTGFNTIQNVGITTSNSNSSFGGLSATYGDYTSYSQYDLTADHSNWWFAIGQKTGYNDQITLDYTTGDKVELYAYY